MKAVFSHTEALSPNISTFWFTTEKPMKYQAGQFTELRIPHDNKDSRGDKRWFTLSSSPSEDMVAITTKFSTPSSSFKQALQTISPGSTVDLASPMGDFVLPKDRTVPVLLVAGGIGCTPYRSMAVTELINNTGRTLSILYAATTDREVVFRDVFDEASDTFSITLSEPSPGWGGMTGRLDGQTILKHLSDPDNQIVYLSGPEPMIQALEKDLKSAGFNRKHIKTDFFPGYVKI